MKTYSKYIIILLTAVLLFGCSQKTAVDVFEHNGLPFIYEDKWTMEISYLDKYYRYFIGKNKPVRFKGEIVYQGKLKGAWAFVEDDTGMVFVDFMASSPNILLPVEQRKEEVIIEGHLHLDDTILNNYKIVPYAYEFIREEFKEVTENNKTSN